MQGGGIKGVACTSPLEVVTTPAHNDQLTWLPGPTSAIALTGGL